jgi:hypothetical protein
MQMGALNYLMSMPIIWRSIILKKSDIFTRTPRGYMKTLILCVTALMLMTSCSSTLVVVEKAYAGKTIKKASLAVIIRDNPPKIDYEGDVEPEFGPGDQNVLIFNYFKKALATTIRDATWLDPVRYEDATIDPAIMTEVKLLTLRKDYDMNIVTPVANTHFEFAGSVPQFVLIIDNLYIGTSIETNTYWSSRLDPLRDSRLGIQSYASVERDIQYSGTGVVLNNTMSFTPPIMPPTYNRPPPMMHSSTTKSLSCEAEISIWDNSAKALVAYGHINSTVKSTFIPVVTMSTWENLTSGFAEGIFSQTPFARSAQ